MILLLFLYLSVNYLSTMVNCEHMCLIFFAGRHLLNGVYTV